MTYNHENLQYIFLNTKISVGSTYVACDLASIGKKNTELIKNSRRSFEYPAVKDSGSKEDTLRGEKG